MSAHLTTYTWCILGLVVLMVLLWIASVVIDLLSLRHMGEADPPLSLHERAAMLEDLQKRWRSPFIVTGISWAASSVLGTFYLLALWYPDITLLTFIESFAIAAVAMCILFGGGVGLKYYIERQKIVRRRVSD